MRLRLIVSVAAGLTVALPAFAQDMAAPAAARSAEASASVPGAADVSAGAETFRTQVASMNEEIRSALESLGSNRRRANMRVESILNSYAPGFEAFAVTLEAYYAAEAAAAPTEEARASAAQAGAAAIAQVRGVVDQTRAAVAQQIQARARQRQSQESMSTGM